MRYRFPTDPVGLDWLRASHANLAVDYALSDPETVWNERTGHVQDHLPDALAGGALDDADFYRCGVPEMVGETQELPEGEGVDADRIYTEGRESDAVEE